MEENRDTGRAHGSCLVHDRVVVEEATVFVVEVESNLSFAKGDSFAVVPCQDTSDMNHSISTKSASIVKEQKSKKNFDERSVYSNTYHIQKQGRTKVGVEQNHLKKENVLFCLTIHQLPAYHIVKGTS